MPRTLLQLIPCCGYRSLLLLLLPECSLRVLLPAFVVLLVLVLWGPPMRLPPMVPRVGQTLSFHHFLVVPDPILAPTSPGKGLLMIPRSGRKSLPGTPLLRSPELPRLPLSRSPGSGPKQRPGTPLLRSPEPPGPPFHLRWPRPFLFVVVAVAAAAAADSLELPMVLLLLTPLLQAQRQAYRRKSLNL